MEQWRGECACGVLQGCRGSDADSSVESYVLFLIVVYNKALWERCILFFLNEAVLRTATCDVAVGE